MYPQNIRYELGSASTPAFVEIPDPQVQKKWKLALKFGHPPCRSLLNQPSYCSKARIQKHVSINSANREQMKEKKLKGKLILCKFFASEAISFHLNEGHYTISIFFRRKEAFIFLQIPSLKR